MCLSLSSLTTTIVASQKRDIASFIGKVTLGRGYKPIGNRRRIEVTIISITKGHSYRPGDIDMFRDTSYKN